MDATLSLSLRNDRREIGRAATAIEAFGLEHGMAGDDVSSVNLALDEILANILSHAYVDKAPHLIKVVVTAGASAMHVVVEDDGRPFNPLTWPPPDLDAPIEHRPIGGLGLHIARALVEAIEYRRDGGKNVLTFARKFGNRR